MGVCVHSLITGPCSDEVSMVVICLGGCVCVCKTVYESVFVCESEELFLC